MMLQNDPNSDYPSKKLQVIVGLLFYSLIASFYLWNVYLYRPEFDKPIFLINSALVYPFNISDDSHLTANWNISITVKTQKLNPMIFEDVKASVLLKGVVVSSAGIESFSLKEMVERRNVWRENEIRANLASSSVPINESIAEAVNYGRTKDGTLTISLSFSSVATMNPGDRENYVNKKHVIASCEDLKLVFATDSIFSPAVFMGPSFECNNVLVHD